MDYGMEIDRILGFNFFLKQAGAVIDARALELKTAAVNRPLRTVLTAVPAAMNMPI